MRGLQAPGRRSAHLCTFRDGSAVGCVQWAIMARNQFEHRLLTCARRMRCRKKLQIISYLFGATVSLLKYELFVCYNIFFFNQVFLLEPHHKILLNEERTLQLPVPCILFEQTVFVSKVT